MAWLFERLNRVFSRLDVVRGNLLSLDPGSAAGTAAWWWIGDIGGDLGELSFVMPGPEGVGVVLVVGLRHSLCGDKGDVAVLIAWGLEGVEVITDDVRRADEIGVGYESARECPLPSPLK